MVQDAFKPQDAGFRFDNSWRRDLPAMGLDHSPDRAPEPHILVLNIPLALSLGLDPDVLAAHPVWFAGGGLPDGAEPMALAYAGHQFGGYSPRLGDGRAHLLGEHIDPQGNRWDIQLKGSGRTPFSRGGDGKAVLAPMLREFLISEAMAALGIATSRSLAVALTGEGVRRDEGVLPGAVVTRVASSHLRIGSFQYAAALRDTAALEALLDYAIARHDPDLAGQEGRALAFFDRVVARQTALIAEWMGVGFVHGVMNTDNMTISGETIDYGPCAFMDAYAPGTVFSSIDRQGRYAYGNQPLILPWNLARLAESLLPLMGESDEVVDLLNARLDAIAGGYRAAWLKVARRKLGLEGEAEGDDDLVDDFLRLMSQDGLDWTQSWRKLAFVAEGRGDLFLTPITDRATAQAWIDRWLQRANGSSSALAHRLRAANPLVIPRNHQVEAALQAATAGDMQPFGALLAAVQRPYDEDPALQGFSLPAPQGFGGYVTFCGT